MEAAPHLLVVDDDREIRDLLARFLRKHGFRVTAAADGRQMNESLAAGRFDLVVLDLMLPGEDGLSICRRLRASSGLPVIMLTAMGEETDRIVGLELGADDYVSKPFNPRELLARVRAVLRRTSERMGERMGERTEAPSGPAGERAEAGGTVLAFEGWRLDLARRELRQADGTLVPLTAGEFDLLRAFVERPGRVLSRDQLLDLTRGRELAPFDRSVDVQLSRLRRKIEADPREPALIKTVRGGGYVFSAGVRHEGSGGA